LIQQEIAHWLKAEPPLQPYCSRDVALAPLIEEVLRAGNGLTDKVLLLFIELIAVANIHLQQNQLDNVSSPTMQPDLKKSTIVLHKATNAYAANALQLQELRKIFKQFSPHPHAQLTPDKIR
jgi:hypothetical protein